MVKTQIDESKQAGASYVLGFYNNVNQLNDFYARYINVLAELKGQIPKNKEQQEAGLISYLDEAQKLELKTALQYLRYAATQTYTNYLTINMSLPVRQEIELDDKKVNLSSLYNSIKDEYVIKQEVAEKYVLSMNTFLMKGIIKQLLETGSQLITDLYANGTTPG